MTGLLDAAIVKAEQAHAELHRRLKAVAELSPIMLTEGHEYRIGYVDGLLVGVKDYLNHAKDEPT